MGSSVKQLLKTMKMHRGASSSAVPADVSLPLYGTRRRLSQRPASVPREKGCDAVNPDKPPVSWRQTGQNNRHGIKMTVPRLLLKNTSSKISSLPLPLFSKELHRPLSAQQQLLVLLPIQAPTSQFLLLIEQLQGCLILMEISGSSCPVSPHY